METKHYNILKSRSLINEEQLEELLSDGWILLQIVQHEQIFYFYFYKN